MQASSAKHSFEEILAAVEQDPSLASEQWQEASGEDTRSTPEDDSPLSGLGSLLSRPELLAKVPLLLKTVQSLTEPLPEAKNDKRPDTPVALLCALRPYLNEHRRQALDTMIRVSRLSESLKSLQ
jgi:hypothetical protein